ncbi:MAG: hypothetical protein ACXWRZ_02335 [Bdellovibrio sp.]
MLTRWPVLFITGHRSIFYFSNYWNIYTSFLAEHGYEVFNLRLPWNNKNLRRQRFAQFLAQQEKQNRHFHIIVDEVTFKEFHDLIQNNRTIIKSVTELTDEQTTKVQEFAPFSVPRNTIEFKKGPHFSFLLSFCHGFHRRLTKQKMLPSLGTLGANPKTANRNSLVLLGHIKTLAEKDLIHG